MLHTSQLAFNYLNKYFLLARARAQLSRSVANFIIVIIVIYLLLVSQNIQHICINAVFFLSVCLSVRFQRQAEICSVRTSVMAVIRLQIK